MSERTITLTEGWLHFPIGREAPKTYVRFDAENRTFAELHLGLVTGQPDFWCGMELTSLIGKDIRLSTDPGTPEELLAGIRDGGPMNASNPLYGDLYREALRPSYHFSTKRGWINDPNGLFFDGENYHLYYQHNPYGILHGDVNIHWGHAVSTDALRWTEYPDAIRPWDSRCHIASGSCLVDTEGLAGYGKGTVIAAFTHLGSRDYRAVPDEELPSEGQFLAYSRDGGFTFTLFPEQPAIPTEDGKNWRDPHLFPHPDGGIGMAVYETTEKGNCVSFYRSADFHHWTRTARAEDLYECPDLFPLTPVNDPTPRWVLYGADGMVRIGDFTDGAFHQTGARFPLDYGKNTYAGQTWNNRDDSQGRMHISWLHSGENTWSNPDSYPGMPFSQCMTVPCLLTLVKTADGYRLHRNPIPALTSLRTGATKEITLCSEAEAVEIHPFTSGDTELTLDCEAPLTLRVGECGFVYDPGSGQVVFDGGKTCILEKKGPLHLRMLTDIMSCECFLQEEISATYGMDMRNRPILLTCEGRLNVSGTSYALSRIWG